MSRVVPSQVVEFIDQAFPMAQLQKDSHENRFSINKEDSVICAAIIDLVKAIPPELIVLPSHFYVKYISAIASLKEALSQWKTRSFVLKRVKGQGNKNPVSIIREALSMCPDEYSGTDLTELNYIKDEELRKSLDQDINAANRALANGEWKAATVLAGSVIEALLLWVILETDQKLIQKAVKELMSIGTFTTKPDNDFTKWGLKILIEVVNHLNIIRDESAAQALLAKNFRNLIHPGREKRLQQSCNRGTALSAVAAVEHIIGDLNK